MIKNNEHVEKRLKDLRNYKIDKAYKNLSREQLEHLATVENKNYLFMYALIEDVYFAIRKGECTDIKEIEEHFDKWYGEYIYPKVDIDFGEV